MPKLICEECGWTGVEEEVLTEMNPFMLEAICYGCPECKEIEPFILACKHEGCWKPATRKSMFCKKHK